MPGGRAQPSVITANVLGQYQAEADGYMLERAFVETPEYRTLVAADYCTVVVGRRGTGKSACFVKLRQHFQRSRNTLTIDIAPDELDIIGLKKLARTFGDDYAMVRATSRLAWHAAILYEVLVRLRRHYRFKLHALPPDLVSLSEHWQHLTTHAAAGRLYNLLSSIIADMKSGGQLDLTALSHALNTKMLQDVVVDGLNQARLRAVVLLDRLDEGWLPDVTSSAFAAGLLTTASNFNRDRTPVCVIAFVRDNIHRAIARLDNDYTRNIEGISLRLHWDEASLFNFACARIRAAFDLSIQQNARLWNRISARKLRDREGFRRCLRLTLYRPRDLLALLNQAFLNAGRAQRAEIIEEDVDSSAKQISHSRLADLIKEYDTVFPGLDILITAFQNTLGKYKLTDVRALIRSAVDTNDQRPEALRHFKLLGQDGLIQALYGVGFLGVFDPVSKQFQFSHDGKAPDTEIKEAGMPILVHPCYHLALNCREPDEVAQASESIFDEHDITVVSEQVELRKREVGTLIAELGTIPTGAEGFAGFERWARRALEVLCAGHLSDFERHPNANGINIRDVVATCVAQTAFWRRLFETYGTRHVVFEIKNYSKLKKADYLQLTNYLGQRYGNAGFIVCRSEDENVPTKELDWIRDFYNRDKGLCIVLCAKILRRLLSKVREVSKHDEVDLQLNKLLNRYERNYLEAKHTG